MTNLLTTTQAAAILNLDESVMRAYCRQGRLGSKIGRQWLITTAELKRFAKKPRPVGNPGWGK